MIAVLVGVSFIALGVWGVFKWFAAVVIILKGFGSVSLIVGGVVAAIAGMSSMKSVRPDVPKE